MLLLLEKLARTKKKTVERNDFVPVRTETKTDTQSFRSRVNSQFLRSRKWNGDGTERLRSRVNGVLAFSIEKNYTLKCFNCSTNSYSFEESIRALHSTPSVKEEEKEHMHAHLGDVARLHHSYHIFVIFV